MAAGIAARVVQIAFALGLLAAALFLAAGRLDWLSAWVLLGIYVATICVNAVLMFRTSLETVAERGRPGEMRGWDKAVGSLWGLVLYILLPVAAGLDFRFGWTGELGVAWHVAGAVLFAVGLALFSWAMVTNAYFSTVVRIQTDRGQTVCKTGPYRFVRHPGYAGANLQAPGMALLLGSFWALIPAAIAVGLMTVRTYLEDRTLQAELAGYLEYVQETRYRLVPGIW
jgi:protein-S-isoprenylcysteine O-methyltransferase Ste14